MENEFPLGEREVEAGQLSGIVSDRTEFFIGELARLDHDWTQRYASLTRRVADLENGRKRSGDDPMELMGSVFLVLIGLQLLPVVLDMVRQWKSSSSSAL